MVQSHLDGLASDAEIAELKLRPQAWVQELWRLLDRADRAIDEVHESARGPFRSRVLSDFEAEYNAIDAAISGLIGAPKRKNPNLPRPAELQLSWTPGHIVAWAAGSSGEADDIDGVLERLQAAGAATKGWVDHPDITVPNGGSVAAVSAPLVEVLGWLAALGSDELASLASDDAAAKARVGPSALWIGRTAAMAVRLAAQGRMVPQLNQAKGGDAKNSAFQVNWAPAMMDGTRILDLARARPGAVAAVEPKQDPQAFTTSVVSDLVDAICQTAASRLEVPAPPPQPRTRSDVGEALLARLDGEVFTAARNSAADVARKLGQWSRAVTGPAKVSLVLLLDPPDSGGAWRLAVMVKGDGSKLVPVELAMVNSSNAKRKDVKEHLARLERLYPPLLRPGERRRGEVILSQSEAWDLMTGTGDLLVACGFDVRVPELSRKKSKPALRLTADADAESVVGAQQLANVRWSAVFGDVELSVEQIRHLARQAKPLVQSNGKWIELDKVDLAKAAKAIEERGETSKLTGADMLRHALGLEGTPLEGGVSVAGSGWAVELLKSASAIPDDLPTRPEGFRGELRSYQADALAWLGFLDSAGLGGCLALDMGLGKTPTMLAHVARTTGEGPTLVIAPPAVVGNWAAEAHKFVPGLKVRVHHGASRASSAEVAKLPDTYDLIITTYGTAVRDVGSLEKIKWSKVVLDEAQAIKNPASDTAQQLRRFDARTRIALTGTPIENGLGDLWAIIDWANPGLVGPRSQFVSQLAPAGNGKEAAESALKALNGLLVFRRTKAEPAIAAELPDRIDELDHCIMTAEQIGLYQAVLDGLMKETSGEEGPARKGAVLAAITALKQICNHPANYLSDYDAPLEGRSGKLIRLNEILDSVFAAEERMLIFTHFASWGVELAEYLSKRSGVKIECYHGGIARGARDRMVDEFQKGTGAGAMVLSLKAGGTGLNLTAASHVVLYDRWWNPAVEDQARDRVWRIGQKNTVIAHRLVCPGTIDERVEEVVAGKRHVANMVLPKSSSVGDLDSEQLQQALGIDPAMLLSEDLLSEDEATEVTV